MKTVKHLSVLLAVLLMVSLLVVGFVVNADEPTTITVTNEAEFADAMLAANKNANIVLANDIALTNGNITMDETYTGIFDGAGYTVSGITNTLFKVLDGATVKNVTFEGTIVSENRKAATVAYDTANNVWFENVTSYVDITCNASNPNAGGIIGYGKTVTCTNVTYAGDYIANSSSDTEVGGIAGYTRHNGGSGTSTYTNCAFTGTIMVNNETAGHIYAGAILGNGREGTNNLVNCLSTGTITINAAEALTDVVASGTAGNNNASTYTITNCVNLTTFVGIEGVDGIAKGNAATTNGLFNATHAAGDPVEVAGVAYQAYTNDDATVYVGANKVFNELPKDPNAPEEVPSFSEGTIAKGEDGKYTIDTDDFAAFVSAREGVKADTAEYRFVIAADIEKFTACENLNLVLNFVKGEEVVATATKNVLKELKVYASATAAGNTYVAADGVLLTGIVVKDIPAQAWETVTVTLVDGDEKVAEGKTTAADVEVEALPGTLLVSGQYNPYFSNEQNTANAFVIWMSDDINGMDVISKIHSGAYTLALNINGTEYTTFASKEAGRYLVLFLDESGVYGIKMGETYEVSFTIYDENGVRLYYTPVHSIKNDTIETPDAPVESTTTNIPLALSGLKQLTVDADTAQLSVACWDSNPAKDAFDGNYFASKMGTNKAASGQVTLTFSLTEAATVSYYTFYTGNDTCTAYPNRSPLSWTIYGKVGEEWVTLSAITETGMEEKWATPYNYKVATPAECKDYKIEFVAASDIFQLNEIVLYASDATATGATAAALMGDAVACMPHDLGYNADVARIRTTMKTDYVAPFPYIPGTETSSIKEITLEGAYAYVKDLTNNGEFVKYEVQEIETSRWCDLNFILEGFVPEAGVEYEILFFFMTGDNARTPNALHVLPMIFNKHNG